MYVRVTYVYPSLFLHHPPSFGYTSPSPYAAATVEDDDGGPKRQTFVPFHVFFSSSGKRILANVL